MGGMTRIGDPRSYDLYYEPYADGGALFLQRKGETSAVAIDDVHQGTLDDGWFEAVVAGLANHPQGRATIERMMTPLADGRVRVAFPGAGTALVDPRQLAVGGTHFGGGEDRVGLGGQRKEEWPAVLEAAWAKAAASTRHFDDPDAELAAGYRTIGNGGLPEWSMQAFGLHTSSMNSVEGPWSPGYFAKDAFDRGAIVVVEMDERTYTVVGAERGSLLLRDPASGTTRAVGFDVLQSAKRVTAGDFP